MDTYKIKVLKTDQKTKPGHEIYVGSISVIDLLDLNSKSRDSRFKIHEWKNTDEVEPGYQRMPDQKRVEKIKHYIQEESKQPMFPTSLLVSSRKPLGFRSIDGDYGELTVDQQLFIIDGQHRIEAFKDIVQSEELRATYGYMELPIVILSNFKYREEVEQFFVINSRQRKIKTDLAQRIYLDLTIDDVSTKLVPEKDKWQVVAAKIVDTLNNEPQMSWYRLIELPNDPKDIKKERVISQNYFIKSLKPFFTGATQRWDYSVDSNYCGKDALKECPVLVEDYWKILKKVYPKAFLDKKNYTLFKTIGVVSLHMVLAGYLRMYPAQNPKDQMEGLRKLLEYARDKNKFTLEFWKARDRKSRNKGGDYAGAYSSGAGHNRIALAILNQRRLTDLK